MTGPRAYTADERAFNAKWDALYSGQRAKAERGESTSTAWQPKADPLRAFIDRSVVGVASAYEPEAEHALAVHVEDGQYSEQDMDAFRATAWASLDEATQAAGLDPEAAGFADAAQAFSDATDQAAADAKAEQVRFREQLHQESMARDPASYGR